MFGGSRNASLAIAARLNQSARVSVTVRRGSRVVKRFKAKMYPSTRTIRLKLSSRGLSRGTYKITIDATRPGRSASLTVAARRL